MKLMKERRYGGSTDVARRWWWGGGGFLEVAPYLGLSVDQPRGGDRGEGAEPLDRRRDSEPRRAAVLTASASNSVLGECSGSFPEVTPPPH